MKDLLLWPGWADLTVAACAVGLAGCLVFMIADHRMTGGHWRDTAIGRWLFNRKLLLASIFTLILLNRAFGDWPGRLPATFILMAAYAVQTFTPYRLLVRAQREVRDENAQRGTQDEDADDGDVRPGERRTGLDRNRVQ